MTKIEEFKINGRTVKVGDMVTVKPSKTGKRDGFVGKVRSGELDKEGKLVSIEVCGAPGRKAAAIRSIRIERVATMHAATQDRVKGKAR
jgi:hypothetical protein